MKALLGQKIGMSQVFSPEGEVVPVTLIQALPNEETLQRNEDADGYRAVQVGLPKQSRVTSHESREDGNKKKHTKTKPAGLKERFVARREFAVEVAEDATELTVAQFEPGDVVEVSGVSKGKGYQGVVKRYGFKGGPASHGHRHVLRQAGSIGSAFPQHVFKGKRMAGRMGGERVTVKNLTVVSVDAEQNLLAVKGAIPGKRGTVVEIKSMS